MFLPLYVEARVHPIDRLHEVSRKLATSPTVFERDLDDYRWLMNRLVGDTVDYAYDSVERRQEMVENDELTDWVLAIQGGGAGGTGPGRLAMAGHARGAVARRSPVAGAR